MSKQSSVSLFHGDCFSIATQLIDAGIRVDAILTDPPYGIMRGMDSITGHTPDGKLIVTQKHEWDTALPITSTFELIRDLTRPKANVLLFAQEPFTSGLITAKHPNVKFCQRLHWLKPHISNAFNCRCACKNVVEDILLFVAHPQAVKGTYKTFNLPRGKKHVKNVFPCPQDRYTPGGCKSYHPTQKPQCLLEDLLRIYTNPGDLVLDFTMGSGSTGVACVRTGRGFIGIEKDDLYFQIAQKRIEEAQP